MLDLIETHRNEIARLCRRFRVRRLEAFGSAASGAFDPARSDLDFLVEFEPGYRAEAFDDYFGLKEGLEGLLGRPVDLVVDKAVRNAYVRAGIDRAREPIFAA
jgi:predicted nucleotidyltransferase